VLQTIEVGCVDCAGLEVGESTNGGLTGLTPVDDTDDVNNSDQELYREGYITVVVIEPSFNVSKAKSLKEYLRTFEF
jgi:hypothetical protein